MIFSVSLCKKMTFNIKADNEDECIKWLMTHDFSDVMDETYKWEVEYDDKIEKVLPDDAEYGIDVSAFIKGD